MHFFVALFALVAAAEPVEAPPAAPESLDALRPLMDDEATLVDALHRFDKRARELGEWEKEQARAHAARGEEDLAKEKMEERHERFLQVDRAYKEALGRYPNNAELNNNYGEFLYDVALRFAAAIKHWKTASILDPELSKPRNNLAIHYCHVGDYSQGLRYFDDALRLEPDNPDYLFNLAQVYLVHSPQMQKLRNWDAERVYREAMKLSRKATELAPSEFSLAQDYAVNFFAGANAGYEVDWRKAAKAWQRARPLARDKDEEYFTWLNEARVWLREGDKEQAARCLREALKIRPESPVARQLLAETE